jgi:hypothetical protein
LHSFFLSKITEKIIFTAFHLNPKSKCNKLNFHTNWFSSLHMHSVKAVIWAFDVGLNWACTTAKSDLKLLVSLQKNKNILSRSKYFIASESWQFSNLSVGHLSIYKHSLFGNNVIFHHNSFSRSSRKYMHMFCLFFSTYLLL